MPDQAIFLAELRETQRTLEEKVSNADHVGGGSQLVLADPERLTALSEAWEHYQTKQIEVSRETLAHLRDELALADQPDPLARPGGRAVA